MARIVCVFVFVCCTGVSARAQEAGQKGTEAVEQGVVAPAEQAVMVEPMRVEVRAARPAALMPLYVSTGALQALDFVTTRRALHAGGAEANPVMRPLVSNTAAFVAVKAGTTVGTIWITERLWKRNRVAAVAMLVGINSAMAVVVSHNARAAAPVK